MPLIDLDDAAGISDVFRKAVRGKRKGKTLNHQPYYGQGVDNVVGGHDIRDRMTEAIRGPHGKPAAGEQ